MTLLTIDEVNARMLALEKLYPQWCKRRLLETWTPYTDSYYLEITNGVNSASVDIDTFAVPAGKRAVLFVSAQQGDETLSVRALFDATEDLLAAAAIASAAVPRPVAPPAPPAVAPAAPTITLPSGQTFKPSDVTTILDTLDILIVPVANQRGYPKYRAEGLFGGVDVNRDYPVLWNKQRATQAAAGGAVSHADYFWGNQTPPKWNPPNPGLGSTPAKTQTATNIIKLMRKRVQTLVNLAAGYPPNIGYPWGFWDNSNVAPMDTAMRYCNPAFGAGTPPVVPMAPAGVAPYYEYMPATSLARLSAAAAAAANATPAVGSFYWTGQARNRGVDTTPPTGRFTPTPDPSGGGSIDYFFSLDICNRIALHIEVGNNVMLPPQASKNVTAIMFALLNHLVAIGPADTMASTVTGFGEKDFMVEQIADWARRNSCP